VRKEGRGKRRSTRSNREEGKFEVVDTIGRSGIVIEPALVCKDRALSLGALVGIRNQQKNASGHSAATDKVHPGGSSRTDHVKPRTSGISAALNHLQGLIS